MQRAVTTGQGAAPQPALNYEQQLPMTFILDLSSEKA